MNDLNFILLLISAITWIAWQIHSYLKTRVIHQLIVALYLIFAVIIGIVRHYA